MARKEEESDSWKGKLALAFGIALLLILVGIFCSSQCPPGGCLSPPPVTGPECGDGTCNGGETCSSCPTDCRCPTDCSCCGNGACQPALGETCATCPSDCICTGGTTCIAPPPPAAAFCTTPPPPCKPNTQSCSLPTDCCSGNCDSGHCCDLGYNWDTGKNCCVNSAGVCSCYPNGYTSCGSGPECCSGNCASGHCCGLGELWDTSQNCCKNAAGVCVCLGVNSGCDPPSPPCCSPFFSCSGSPPDSHCCPPGKDWLPLKGCCGNPLTGDCDCRGINSPCTGPECCPGNFCSDSHCCPTGTAWDVTCCKDPSGNCITDPGGFGWYCLGGTAAPPSSSCGTGGCEPAKGESCTSCPIDCHCPADCSCCGNGVCTDPGEDCNSCPADCACLPGFTCAFSATWTCDPCNNDHICQGPRENNANCPGDCTPSCSLSASPPSGSIPLTSTITAAYANVPDGDIVTLKCEASGAAQSLTLFGGKASLTCTYPGTGTFTPESAYSGTSCTTTVTASICTNGGDPCTIPGPGPECCTGACRNFYHGMAAVLDFRCCLSSGQACVNQDCCSGLSCVLGTCQPPVCDNDHTCDPGENGVNCPSDCPVTCTLTGPPYVKQGFSSGYTLTATYTNLPDGTVVTFDCGNTEPEKFDSIIGGSASVTCSAMNIGSYTAMSSYSTTSCIATVDVVPCFYNGMTCSNGGDCCSLTCNGAPPIGTCACSGQAQGCSQNSDCCAGNSCQGGFCCYNAGQGPVASPTPCCSGKVVPVTNICECAGPSKSCSTGADCCSGSCTGEVCDCSANGNGCIDNSDCCTGVCQAGTCVEPCENSPGAPCPTDNCCAGLGCYNLGGNDRCFYVNGHSCTSAEQGNCATGYCPSGTCVCKPGGMVCTEDYQCCSYNCAGSSCS